MDYQRKSTSYIRYRYNTHHMRVSTRSPRTAAQQTAILLLLVLKDMYGGSMEFHRREFWFSSQSWRRKFLVCRWFEQVLPTNPGAPYELIALYCSLKNFSIIDNIMPKPVLSHPC